MKKGNNTLTSNHKSIAKSVILIYFCIALLLSTVALQGLSFFEKRYLDTERQTFLETGYQYVTYLRDSVNARIANMAASHPDRTVADVLETEASIKAIIKGTIATARLFDNDVWLVDNNLNFIYDASPDSDYASEKPPINLLKNSVQDSHYGGKGLDEIGAAMLRGKDGLPSEEWYYLWNDDNTPQNKKEWCVWAIIPSPNATFSGTQTYWAIALTIKDNYIYEHFTEFQTFLYVSMSIFIVLVWISALFMVAVYVKSSKL